MGFEFQSKQLLRRKPPFLRGENPLFRSSPLSGVVCEIMPEYMGEKHHVCKYYIYGYY